MIHIIDPRTQSPLPYLSFENRPKSARTVITARYINDRNLFCADLVAIRTAKGLYRILKSHDSSLGYSAYAGRTVRRATLNRYIAEVLARHS